MKTKRFPLRDLLTVTTGRLLTKPSANGNSLGNIYKLLRWLTDDEPFAHQLGRFADECKPWLLKLFPELAKANDDLYALDGFRKTMRVEVAIDTFLDVCVKKGCKPTYNVPRLQKGEHVVFDPIAELQSKGVDSDRIIAVMVKK